MFLCVTSAVSILMLPSTVPDLQLCHIRSPSLVVALILSRLDYGNVVPSANTPCCFQSVLSAAVRFICNLRCCDHITYVLVVFCSCAFQRESFTSWSFRPSRFYIRDWTRVAYFRSCMLSNFIVNNLLTVSTNRLVVPPFKLTIIAVCPKVKPSHWKVSTLSVLFRSWFSWSSEMYYVVNSEYLYNVNIVWRNKLNLSFYAYCLFEVSQNSNIVCWYANVRQSPPRTSFHLQSNSMLALRWIVVSVFCLHY